MLGESVGTLDPIFSLLWMVVCVIAVAVLAYLVTKYVAGRGGAFGWKTGGGLEILAQLPLGREQKLLVARAGERYFLLGVTASKVSMLAEFTAEEAALWRERAEEEPAENPGFRQALNTVLRQKGRR